MSQGQYSRKRNARAIAITATLQDARRQVVMKTVATATSLAVVIEAALMLHQVLGARP